MKYENQRNSVPEFSRNSVPENKNMQIEMNNCCQKDFSSENECTKVKSLTTCL